MIHVDLQYKYFWGMGGGLGPGVICGRELLCAIMTRMVFFFYKCGCVLVTLLSTTACYNFYLPYSPLTVSSD